MSGEIQRVAKFLDKMLTDDQQLIRLTDHLRFENFEKNESVNLENVRRQGVIMNNNENQIKFVRKGDFLIF